MITNGGKNLYKTKRKKETSFRCIRVVNVINQKCQQCDDDDNDNNDWNDYNGAYRKHTVRLDRTTHIMQSFCSAIIQYYQNCCYSGYHLVEFILRRKLIFPNHASFFSLSLSMWNINRFVSNRITCRSWPNIHLTNFLLVVISI